MNKVLLKEFDKVINELPKTNDMVSAFSSVSVKELRKAVDRFKYAPNYQDLLEENNKQQKEIQRLNNLIDELEKDLTKVLEDMYNSLVHINGRGYYSASLVPLEDELNKLKELKGSDKDE